MKSDQVSEKSYIFALEIINIYKKIISEHKESTLGKQLLKSGTSIGANIAKAKSGVSKREFIVKLSISLKEARETMYWLNLLKDSKFLQDIDTIINLNDELIALLTAIIKSAKEKQ